MSKKHGKNAKKNAKTAKNADKKTTKKAAGKALQSAKSAKAPKSAKAGKKVDKKSSKKIVPGKLVYFFGDKGSDGDASMKNLLGGKGANLAEMCGIGLPVPPGFTITTEVCAAYDPKTGKYPKELAGQVDAAIARLEKT